MDPYLEGELWPEFHDHLANQICEQLAPRLRPRYVAELARRYVMTQPLPGVYAALHGRTLSEARRVHFDISCPEAQDCPEAAQPAVELPSPLPEEIALLSVEIREMAEHHLVTVIEILSPVNKHSDGVRSYRRRRTALLRTSVHLMEIDLLRQGERIELIGEPPPAPYYIYLSRVQRRPYTQVWPVGLRQPLPVVPVPLLPADADIPLDLQAAVDACFQLVGYDRLINYSQPLPNLAEADLAWLAEIQPKG
jgi:hypothetical protein